MLENRAARGPGDRRHAGTAIARRALDLWDGRSRPAGAARVASYLAYGHEPATGELVDGLAERGVEVIVPVVLADGLLDWVRYDGAAAMAPNRYGIDEPTGPRLGTEAVATADLLVVPGLAVDPEGHRLGRGGGYYDRALARVGAQVPRVIVVYDDEVLAAVPHEPHDEQVDIAVTPTRTLTLRHGR